ncbi:MAG TPA: hypothetical protein VFT12_04860 [Thermoanaerobaculia bacterium]|nr:hypothetical protein [Thermoanaerobaculia bacterium]
MSLPDALLRRFPRLRDLPRGSYVVGGAVRDLLLGVDPVDVDIACSDPAAAAARISPRLIRLGTEDHLSAWRVVDGGHVYDFAAMEGGAIGPDLARRDFTVNAMAVSLDEGTLLDPHGGQRDLERRLVRMIDPSNFDDDPLRCLKAVRMAVRFDFNIDPETMAAIRSRAASVLAVAPERVIYELEVIFSSGRFRKAVALLREAALDGPLFGKELRTDYGADDVSFAGAMALLVTDPKEWAKRWRWSAGLLRQTVALQSLLAADGEDLRVALYDAGDQVAQQLPAVLRALGRDGAVVMPDFSIRPLLDGEEIAAATGLRPGAELGRLKRALLEAQIRGEVKTAEEAAAFIAARR